MINSNYCLINPQGGLIEVRLSANNSLRSSAIFYLGKPKKPNGYDIVEQHDADSGDNGSVKFKLSTKSNKLLNHAFAWSINACIQMSQIENAILKIEFWQDGNKCKTVRNTTYYGHFPQCSEGKQRSMKNQVIYIEQPQTSNTNLWASI